MEARRGNGSDRCQWHLAYTMEASCEGWLTKAPFQYWSEKKIICLTGAIFETGAYGVPSKSPKSFICGGVRQTINLKSPGKGAPPSTPSWGLQWHPLFWMQYFSLLTFFEILDFWNNDYLILPIFWPKPSSDKLPLIPSCSKWISWAYFRKK